MEKYIYEIIFEVCNNAVIFSVGLTDCIDYINKQILILLSPRVKTSQLVIYVSMKERPFDTYIILIQLLIGFKHIFFSGFLTNIAPVGTHTHTHTLALQSTDHISHSHAAKDRVSWALRTAV